ncbi:STAS domain-containing protein [Desulfosudis oleivorans]|uniref:STAS domain-containing protein n=1 Tax=Desulfosudis oleivorans (strain DSM 6200 / JCM 39069 / Hxd3) TaxID=96561 RepID=A8ZVX1_DESOH|nr:STAS domain-containing protein [Desulfosudis oleivorans]ABW66680.1 hypothetical protein Dole_0870 [Desulfosudis oleivorans Hxd3]
MGKIVLHGDCLVNRAEELHQLFCHLLKQSDDQVAVDMSAVGRCDVSFFQVICSAARSFAQRDKHLALDAPPPAAFSRQLEKSGMASACRKCDCGSCLFKASSDAMQAGDVG